MSLSQRRDALFPNPSAEMLSSQVSIPCQVVEPGHTYACCYTWNRMHLLVVLCGCPRRQADRMFLAARPGRQHTICWPGERGHGDPQGRRMRCCDCGWTTVACWQSRLCQHISRAIFKMTSSGDSPIFALVWECTFFEGIRIVVFLTVSMLKSLLRILGLYSYRKHGA